MYIYTYRDVFIYIYQGIAKIEELVEWGIQDANGIERDMEFDEHESSCEKFGSHVSLRQKGTRVSIARALQELFFVRTNTIS